MAKKKPKRDKVPPAEERVAEDVRKEAKDELKSSSFPIVCVGASAGGLEAFNQLLSALPPDTGMAFVFIQHLAPSHASMLAEILGRATSMPVTEVRDEPVVKPNNVYVIPPNRTIVISNGALQLHSREATGQHRPIDMFLRTLAEDQGHKAIGVILSGSASDGTLGLEAIKAEGGITFAQDSSAQYDSMPRSAIAAGCVDFVLPPQAIAKEIARIARHPYISPLPAPTGTEPGGEPNLQQIIQMLRHNTGVDFTDYKANTLYRRITRRLVLHKMEGLKEYLKFLKNNPAEVEALYQDILISVTSFFRNPEAFDAAVTKVFPQLLKDRSRHQPLRTWVLGCSTGEEAYSIAISYAEYAAKVSSVVPMQIFATDLNGAGIEKARAGIYSKNIVQDVAPDRLRRFFVEMDGSLRISKPIRDMCVFARHNVLCDPPFSHVDLISCRNLLIYLEQNLQQRVLPILHYALKPGGFLWLGASETIGAYRDLFDVEDGKHKIYFKKPGPARIPVNLRNPEVGGHEQGPHGRSLQLREFAPGGEVQREADRIVLAKYVPACVLVNPDLEILQFRGDTGNYLTPAPGKASLNLLKMAREGLLVGLRGAILKAKREEAPVCEEGLRVKSNGGYRLVNIEILPIRGNARSDASFLVIFEDADGGKRAQKAAEAKKSDARKEGKQETSDRQVARLTQELAATREYLQSVIEQQEAANEELQSANEEVQSANEELQSINEELETSKEEIQSSNEELATVNDELQNRNLELSLSNNDLVNLLANVQVVIVMLGRDLRIRRVTPAAEKMLNLIPTDVGRPITDIKLNLSITDLEPMLVEAIDTVSVKEREVQDKQGHWYSLRIRPYKTLENKIDGAVLVLVDIDRIKRAHEFVEKIVDSVAEPLLVLDSEMHVLHASHAFYKEFHSNPAETEGRSLFELGQRQWNSLQLRHALEETAKNSKEFRDFELDSNFPGLGPRTMLLSAIPLEQVDGANKSILLTIKDITDRKRLEIDLRKRVDDLATADTSKNDFLAMLGHELRNPLTPIINVVTMLKRGGTENAIAENALAIMERQTHLMTRLVDDLLDISRITNGKIQLRMEVCDLGVIIKPSVESISYLFDGRGQKLAVSLAPEPMVLEADSTRLEQVFVNLFSNASKFTGHGGHIWLTAEHNQAETASGPRQAVVRIRDDGAGIPKNLLPRVFDLFTQGDQPKARAQTGLGIGLKLVRSLVELHGGRVEAKSAGPGKGSEFVVYLPLVKDKQPMDRAPSTQSTVNVGDPPRRILIVDDNVDVAQSLAMLLEDGGYEVAIAHNGTAALEVAAAKKPQVILLDIGLPGADGYEVARKVRQMPEMNDTLLIALTGYGQGDDRKRSIAAGFDNYLTKPTTLQALEEAFRGAN